jgi:hypothetical protein
MARFVDPLVVGRVIGEVVDLFVPSISMTVAYDGPKDISNGCLLKPSATAAPPLVRISGRRNDLYTLVRTACMSFDLGLLIFLLMMCVSMSSLQLAACVHVVADHDGPRCA